MIAVALLIGVVGLVVWGLERNHRRNGLRPPYGAVEPWGFVARKPEATRAELR